MKYSATILTSLLLLGVCSARSRYASESPLMDASESPLMGASASPLMDASEMPQMDDSSIYILNSRPDSEQSKTDDRSSQQWVRSKDTVGQTLRNTYQQLMGDNDSPMAFDDLPIFTDPIEIEDGTVDYYSTTTMMYDTIRFEGLSRAYDAKLDVDRNSHMATLTLSLKTAQIYGHYKYSGRYERETAGKFNVKLTGNPTFVYTYQYYLVKGDTIYLPDGKGKLLYGDFDAHYDTVSSLSKEAQKSLLSNLLRLVGDKVYDEVHAKLGSRIEDMYRKESAEKVMQRGVTKAISEMQQAVSKNGALSVDLTSDNKEIMHNQLRAQISSVKLNGIEKFYLAKNQVSAENSDKIRAQLQLAIDRPTATAVVSIQKADETNSPFQKITVDFDMEQLMADILFEKPARQSGLELRSVKTSLNRIRPLNTEKLEGDVSSLVKEKLADHMKRYVEEGLKNLIQNTYISTVSSGVLPPNLSN